MISVTIETRNQSGHLSSDSKEFELLVDEFIKKSKLIMYEKGKKFSDVLSELANDYDDYTENCIIGNG